MLISERSHAFRKKCDDITMCNKCFSLLPENHKSDCMELPSQ